MSPIQRSCPLLLVLSILTAACSSNVAIQGRHLVDDGEYSTAIEVLRAEVAKMPVNTHAWRELGYAYYKDQKLDDAQQALDRADAADARTQLIRGLISEAANDLDAARLAYIAALEANPTRKTRKILESHLDILIQKKIQATIRYAISTEASIVVDTFPLNSVAVVGFDSSLLALDMRPLALGLAEFTSVDLSKVSSLTVLERVRIHELQKELKLATTPFIDAVRAPRHGKLLGCRTLITGSLVPIGDELRLDGRIIGTRDASVQSVNRSQEKLTAFFKLEKDFVFRTLNALDVTLTVAERDAIKEVPTESYLALLAYCSGLEYERVDLPEKARDSFEEAVAHDGDFAQAREGYQRASRATHRQTYGAVTRLQLEQSLVRENVATEYWMGSRLTQTSATWDMVGWESGQTQSTAQPNPQITGSGGGTGSIIVRGNLDDN